MQGDLCRNIFLTGLFEIQYLFEIYHTSITIKKSENVVKKGCLEKCLLWRVQISFLNERGTKILLCKNLYFAKLLRGLYLSKILELSSTVKTS